MNNFEPTKPTISVDRKTRRTTIIIRNGGGAASLEDGEFIGTPH